MPRLVDATLVLLNEQSICQQIESDSDIDEDDTEHDEVLMDAVSDLLPAFSKSMGPHFAPILDKLFSPLMKFAVDYLLNYMIARLVHLYLFHLSLLILQKASRPLQDRTMVVATLAEVAQNMGPSIAGYVDVM